MAVKVTRSPYVIVLAGLTRVVVLLARFTVCVITLKLER